MQKQPGLSDFFEAAPSFEDGIIATEHDEGE